VTSKSIFHATPTIKPLTHFYRKLFDRLGGRMVKKYSSIL